MKAHQFEIAFAADSKLNTTNCGFLYLFNKNSRYRQSEDWFSHSGMLTPTQTLFVFLTLSCHFHSFSACHKYQGFKYYFGVLRKKKAVEWLSPYNFGKKSFQQNEFHLISLVRMKSHGHFRTINT